MYKQEAHGLQRSPDKSVILQFLEMSSCMRIKLVKNVSATGHDKHHMMK